MEYITEKSLIKEKNANEGWPSFAYQYIEVSIIRDNQGKH